jgi:hypothetical protein
MGGHVKRKVQICMAVILMVLCSNLGQAEKKVSFIPSSVGTEWIFEGDGEVEKIKIEESTIVEKENCLRVEWWAGNYNKQTEYWKYVDDGILLLGRRASGFDKIFDKPYYFIKYKKGEKWTGEINLSTRQVVLNYSNEGEELVKTKLGDFKAVKIRIEYKNTINDRWFAPEVGIVKYASFRKISEDNIIKTSEKILVKCHIE